MQTKAIEILKLAGGVTQDAAPDNLKKFLSKGVTAKRVFHCCGGCRMGDDAKTSVVNRDCRLHDVENVFLADGSIFPTGSGVNPTLTIQANAFRVGARIVELSKSNVV